MPPLQSLDALRVELQTGLTQEHVGEKPTAHADLAMDAPDRQFDALCIERLLSGKDVLIDAVNKRAVEIKQEDRLDSHVGALAERSGREVLLPRPVLHCVFTSRTNGHD